MEEIARLDGKGVWQQDFWQEAGTAGATVYTLSNSNLFEKATAELLRIKDASQIAGGLNLALYPHHPLVPTLIIKTNCLLTASEQLAIRVSIFSYSYASGNLIPAAPSEKLLSVAALASVMQQNRLPNPCILLSESIFQASQSIQSAVSEQLQSIWTLLLDQYIQNVRLNHDRPTDNTMYQAYQLQKERWNYLISNTAMMEDSIFRDRLPIERTSLIYAPVNLNHK